MPMLTSQPWFGPKTFGWGWTPVSWQGWLLSALCVVVVVLCSLVLRNRTGTVVSLASVALLCLACWLTGTKPGGRVF